MPNHEIDEDFWSDRFHVLAFWAYAHQSAAEGGVAPSVEGTRERAYRYFERDKRGLEPEV
ncbi:hypothetical protein [Paludisphaera rhizosphaerae]|uniref:hypothetical protein n=1 Tax=Paludisphaera rhizosphaerae TaxID=2711216 RepID=UPI0013ED2E35|nr:hypothetical protein [Paludisphaera rhizosphaerae]